MKKSYGRVCASELLLELESSFLTASYVEVQSDVKVEEYKDGFSNDLGEDGFVVTFE